MYAHFSGLHSQSPTPVLSREEKSIFWSPKNYRKREGTASGKFSLKKEAPSLQVHH